MASDQSSLDTINEKESGNYIETTRVLGETLHVCQEFSTLYNWLFTALQTPAIKHRENSLFAIQFAMKCQYHMHMALLALFRGHATDPLLFIRQAVETCAFAARIRLHPHLLQVWAEASKDAKSYKAYQEKFTQRGLFPRTDAILMQLYDRYDFASKLMHSSVYSMSLHMQYDVTQSDALSFEWQYFDMAGRGNRPLLARLFYILLTHKLILIKFAEMFDKELGDKMTDWNVRLNAVDAKTILHQNTWRPFLEEELSRSRPSVVPTS